MAGPPSPIDIATPTRHASTSPSDMPIRKTSTLTSQLRGASPETSRIQSGTSIGASQNNGYGSSLTMSGRDSFTGGMSQSNMPWGGSRPISMKGSGKEKPRRESVAGSLMGGMSWGGVSVGSWIRDDIIMTGSSPFAYQSPSFHSSSYLPKMEANFMRDFSCCGMTLPTLHDLLQHYEECHAQQASQSMQRPNQSTQTGQTSPPDSKAAIAAGAAAAVQQQQQAEQQRLQQQQQQMPQSSGQPTSQAGVSRGMSSPSASAISGIQLMRQQQQAQSGPTAVPKQTVQTVQDMDTVEDMEMDDVEDEQNEQTPPPLPPQSHPQMQQASTSHFGQQKQRSLDPLGLNTSNISSQMQGHHGLRTSQPPTPVASNQHAHPYQHNPTVSSVNTPTFSSQPMQQQGMQAQPQHAFSPESSVPGTPSELDADFTGNMGGDMQGQPSTQMPQGQNLFGFGFGAGNEMLDLCIDEPAKRLFSPNGGYNPQQQQFAQLQMNGGQFGYNHEVVRTFQEQQILANPGGNAAGLMSGEESKPHRCPVIGCEKAYKNQNGLKYHKQHGHQNQQLHKNEDETFSIVNPETSVPYPGTLGMEKEKPYRCEVCGKRYKNLNGLKYHKQHSPPCNPDLKLGGGMGSGMPGLPMNMGPNGLGGIGEEQL